MIWAADGNEAGIFGNTRREVNIATKVDGLSLEVHGVNRRPLVRSRPIHKGRNAAQFGGGLNDEFGTLGIAYVPLDIVVHSIPKPGNCRELGRGAVLIAAREGWSRAEHAQGKHRRQDAARKAQTTIIHPWGK